MNDYILVFSIGLLGAIHCVGMCGGLIMACGMRCGGGFSFSLAYNAGRVLTYTLLGFLMGFLGKALITAGLLGKFQSALPVVAGGLMIFIGLDMLGLLPEGVGKFFSKLFPLALHNQLAKNRIKKERPAAFFLGMANGLIPCGILYAVGARAAAAADPLKGMLLMASLGAGTFLPLLFTGSLTGFLGRMKNNIITALSSVLIIALGLKSIFHGTGFVATAFAFLHHC